MEKMIANLRALGRDGIAEIVKEATTLVEGALRETASAGTDPEGKAWPPKKDGSRPLRRAALAIHCVQKGGKLLRAAVRGYYVFHHYGTGRDPKRALLPDGGGGLPKPIADALKLAARRVFQRKMGGR